MVTRTLKHAELYAKLRKKGFSVKLSDSLIKIPSLARKMLSAKRKK